MTVFYCMIVALLFNYVGGYIIFGTISWAYTLWLWLLSKDISFEGWVFWRGFIPIARFRLISKKSWFAKAWANWYGHALLGVIIHRDEQGTFDDNHVEKTIIHELRHNQQQLILGFMFYILYGIDYLLHGYYDVWFEKDARAAEEVWVSQGRPKKFNFGKRY